MFTHETSAARIALPSTVAALLAGLLFSAGLTACKSTPATPPPPDDAALSAAVSSKLADDPSLSGEQIHATVKDGVVTLTGNISSDSQNALAYRDASGVPGVKDVTDKLVFPTSSGGAALGGSSIP
jgi:hypothetical protein